MQLGSEHIEAGSSKILGLCPTTGLQHTQWDLKLSNVVIAVSKANIGGYVVKCPWFVSSKLSSALFLVSTSSICSRKRSSTCSRNLMDDLCTAVLFSQQVSG